MVHLPFAMHIRALQLGILDENGVCGNRISPAPLSPGSAEMHDKQLPVCLSAVKKNFKRQQNMPIGKRYGFGSM
jgi:hypothetical protein